MTHCKLGLPALVFCALVLAYPPGTEASDVDFTNYTSPNDYVFRVRNNTSKRLVAFKSELREENLLGGNPANASQHGLKKKAALFTSAWKKTVTAP